MNLLGFETTWLLPNLGSALFFLGFYPLMLVVLAILSIMATYCYSKCANKHRQNFRGYVFWNQPIAFLSDNYTVVQICCIYNMRYRSWISEEAQTNSGLALAIMIILLLYPLLMQLFLYRNREKLNLFSFKRKFGAAYARLNVNGKS